MARPGAAKEAISHPYRLKITVNGGLGIVNKQLCDTQPLQTLAKGDKITLTVERVDGGKLRATCASCYPIRRI
jgi:hypothetical protein